MSKRRRILLPLAVALLAAALYAILHSQPEPSYQGRSLSSWLAEFDQDLTNRASMLLGEVSPEENSSESQRRQNATEAVCQIGTNALPCLLSWIRYEPPAWQEKLDDLFQRLGLPWNPGRQERRQHDLQADKAEIAFQILGPSAKTAIPELTRLSNAAKTLDSAMRCMHALSCLGEGALPPLVNVLTNATGNKGPAMYAIWTMGTNARPAVPALIQCLKDQDRSVRDDAASYLGQLKLEPGLVVPALTTAPGPS